MNFIEQLLETLSDGAVLDVRIGLHWTAVVADVGGIQRCGLSSTLFAGHSHGDDSQPAVPQAGQLETLTGRELAGLALSEQPTLASLGVAAINALLPRAPQAWVDANAEEVITLHGQGKRVAMVGHFPFVPRLRQRVGELIVLEQQLQQGDMPAEAAPDVLPEAQVVVITGMTIANHTLEDLLRLCSPDAFVIVMGPSTPLSPLLFDWGVSVISGSVVTDIEAVLRTVSQGGNFRQLHRAGVRLVNLFQSLR